MVSNITIPYQRSIQVNQSSNHGITTIRGQEMIGLVEILPNRPSTVEFLISPITFDTTRLYNISKNFQKFRFTRLNFRVMSNLPTTVGGTITTGFSSNPDHKLAEGQLIQPQIFALDGAQISNLWVHCIVRCPLKDKSKWYNVDTDSVEIMQTAQGKVYLQTSGGANITSEIDVPVVIDYEIQLMGNSMPEQPDSFSTVTFPAAAWAKDVGNNELALCTSLQVQNAAYRTLFNATVSKLVIGNIYKVEPQIVWTASNPEKLITMIKVMAIQIGKDYTAISCEFKSEDNSNAQFANADSIDIGFFTVEEMTRSTSIILKKLKNL